MYTREWRFIVEDNGSHLSRCLCASKIQKRLATVGELHDQRDMEIMPFWEILLEGGVVNLGPFLGKQER
jgi:hypothetical protein